LFSASDLHFRKNSIMQAFDDYPKVGNAVTERFDAQWKAWGHANTFKEHITGLVGLPDERIAGEVALAGAMVAARREIAFYYDPANQALCVLLPDAFPTEETNFFQVQEKWRARIFGLAEDASISILDGFREQKDKESVAFVANLKKDLESLEEFADRFIRGVAPDAIEKGKRLVEAIRFWSSAVEEGALSKKALEKIAGGSGELEFVSKAGKMATLTLELLPGQKEKGAMVWIETVLKPLLEGRLASSLSAPLQAHEKVLKVVSKFCQAFTAATQEAAAAKNNIPASLRPKRSEFIAAAKALTSEKDKESVFADIEAKPRFAT
jgi:hypothetical protein